MFPSTLLREPVFLTFYTERMIRTLQPEAGNRQLDKTYLTSKVRPFVSKYIHFKRDASDALFGT